MACSRAVRLNHAGAPLTVSMDLDFSGPACHAVDGTRAIVLPEGIGPPAGCIYDEERAAEVYEKADIRRSSPFGRYFGSLEDLYCIFQEGAHPYLIGPLAPVSSKIRSRHAVT